MNTGAERFLFYKEKQKKPIGSAGEKKSEGVNCRYGVGWGQEHQVEKHKAKSLRQSMPG